MQPILDPSSAKRIATRILVTAELNGRSCFEKLCFSSKLATEAQEQSVKTV